MQQHNKSRYFLIHELDIELKGLLQQYIDGINTVAEFKKNWQTKDECISHLTNNIYYYCTLKNVEFDTAKIVHVKPESGSPYWLYLSYMLVFYPTFNISSLLTYHLEHYHKTKEEFLETVRSYVVKMVYQLSPFDNNLRLEKVSHWSLQERKEVKKILPKIKKGPATDLKLVWDKERLTVLDRLSKSLFPKYTSQKNSFTHVFTKHNAALWKKNETIFLAILLQNLKIRQYISVSGDSNKKGYFLAANNLFAYDSDKKYASNYFSNTISRMKRSKPDQYNMMIKKVQKLIDSCEA